MPFSASPAPWVTATSDELDLSSPLQACCHGSRLLGSDSSIVLHGGGNTSIKMPWDDLTGRTIDALYVKGSGWDLATIEPAGFTPLRMSRLYELLELDSLSDENMAGELGAAKLNSAAPAPSVESLLHAFLPFEAVQHSHADVIVALTNTVDGEANVREVFGDSVVVIPYVMPGFDLARLVKDMWPTHYHDGMTGMVLLNHGLFTFGRSTEVAYRRHVDLIMKAQAWINDQPRIGEPGREPERLEPLDTIKLSGLRRSISQASGRPMIMTSHRDRAVTEFLGRSDMADLATRGPLTPDHILRTKRVPLVGIDVAGYADDYRRYFAQNVTGSERELTMVDPAPRVVLDPTMGMLTVGTSAKEANIVEDIYRHTMATIVEAEDRLGGYQALRPGALFDVEYWDLEQAKLRRAGDPPPLSGQVAMVTGAASGIGRACVSALLGQGAAVVGLDLSVGVQTVFEDPAFIGIACDVTDDHATGLAIDAAVARFGGIDIAVLAAGVFPDGQLIADLSDDVWRHTMAVNVDAAASLLRRLYPLLVNSPASASVILIGSKNAPAPGPGAAAYSVSKAALTQLGRLCALEWGQDGIRVNTIHPDAVFDTGLWSDELIAARAAKYGLTVDEYRSRNLLGTEVTSDTVAAAVVALCGNAFAATTGAQIPIDGGNERVV